MQVHQHALGLGHLPLNCPQCGQRLIYVRARNLAGITIANSDAEGEDTIYVYHCSHHGPFRLSRTIAVRPGD